VLENVLLLEITEESEPVKLNGTEFIVERDTLSNGFTEVCVRFSGSNGREYKKCGLKHDGMKKG
jgi:hypothetical protein